MADVRRANPALDPMKSDQAKELNDTFANSQAEWDALNKDAYHCVVEMLDLDHTPSLPAKLKHIAPKQDGRAAWKAVLSYISTTTTTRQGQLRAQWTAISAAALDESAASPFNMAATGHDASSIAV